MKVICDQIFKESDIDRIQSLSDLAWAHLKLIFHGMLT